VNRFTIAPVKAPVLRLPLVATAALLTVVAACGDSSPEQPSAQITSPVVTTGSTLPASTVPSSVSSTVAITPVVNATTPLPPGFQSIVSVADGPITLAATDDSIWVEDHRDDYISRVDPKLNQEVDRFPDVRTHCAVATGAGFVWASHARPGSVLKVDPVNGDVIGTIRLSEACGLAASDDDLWATSSGRGAVVRYDPVTLEEKASIKLAELLFGVAIGPDAVWVQSEADGGTIFRVDPVTNAVSAEIAVDGASAIIVGFDSVWVAARAQHTVDRIDPATNAVVETIEMPGEIGGIGVGPDGIWVTGFGNGQMWHIGPDANAISGTIDTSYGNLGPPLFAFDSMWVAALDQNVLLRLSPTAFDDL
jgi:streptogramin lyase